MTLRTALVGPVARHDSPVPTGSSTGSAYAGSASVGSACFLTTPSLANVPPARRRDLAGPGQPLWTEPFAPLGSSERRERKKEREREGEMVDFVLARYQSDTK